jgi:hypothetical protein
MLPRAGIPGIVGQREEASMHFPRLGQGTTAGAIIGLLVGAALVLPTGPLELAAVHAEGLAARPRAQCVEAPEVTEWRGRFGRIHVGDQYQYYCGPHYEYSAEWFAAHVGAYPQYYAVYEEEPTHCVTYLFRYENRWYCYTGP